MQRLKQRLMASWILDDGMKIRELIVGNFRGFEGEVTFPLSERFTVVAGVNGRGKTALLDGLALLISRFFRALSWSHGKPKAVTAADVYGDAGDMSLRMIADCAGVPLDYSIDFDATTNSSKPTRLAKVARDRILKNYGDPERADDQAPIAVYYTTDRAGLRLPRRLPTSLSTGQQLAHDGALSSRLVDYRDFMARYRVWRAQEHHASLDAFDRALVVFLEGFSAVEVENNPLRLTVQKGTHRLSLSQLSEGERSFVAVIGDLVRRLALANPDLDDLLLGHGIVLIDELELHLHPKWQREIVEKLKSTFPNVQFISTTHSPFVIQSLQPGELINLDPEEFGEYADQSIEDITENVMGVDLPQKSQRYLKMMAAAEDYYRLLRDHGEGNRNVEAAERRLNELSAPFSNDPAFQALLNLERAAERGGQDDASG